MPKVIGTQKVGTITKETQVPCDSCGAMISSLSENCPSCGATRRLGYKHSEVVEGEGLEGENLSRVRSGADKCPHCNSLSFNYDANKRGYVCAQCGAGDGTKSDHELAGGSADVPSSPALSPSIHPTHHQDAPPPSVGKKIGLGALSALGLAAITMLIVALVTTHPVSGKVSAVSWQIEAHQEQYVQKSGEGLELPPGATLVGSETRYWGDQENIIGETHGEYYVNSTPEVIGHTHSEIQIETPGAIYTSEPYICSGPTMEPGGSVSYDMCTDTLQDDSTWGIGESAETPVYAPVVPVLQTTVPTLIYGTPTPINKTWYFYTYWEWVNTGKLNTTRGENNHVSSPTGQSDATHRVVVDTQTYQVTVIYDNGHQEVYESGNPELLQKYLLGSPVLGRFNMFNGFVGDDR